MKITRCFSHIRKTASGVGGAMLVGLIACVSALVAAPSARAQIAPVSLTHEVLPDSKIANRVVLLPVPRVEPRKPVTDSHKRLYFVMSAGVYAAAGLDVQETASFHNHFDEYDPLAKPLVGLPTPAYFAAGALFGVNWLGWKMARSPRWHKICWVPQVTSMAGNLAGYSYTRSR